MPNQLHRTLAEAIANAPTEPVASYYEMNPVGTPEAKRAQLRAAVRQAVDAGLKVEILAAEATLAEALMLDLREFEGAVICPGPADQPGYFRIKVCRAITPRER